MREYLFLFTIGPVQRFIMQARKSRDLLNASSILSYLINTAYKKLLEDPDYQSFQATPIFPHKPESEYQAAPNRFLVRLTLNNEEEGISLGKKLTSVVNETFRLITDQTILSEANRTKKFDTSDGFIYQQLEDCWDIFWAFEPLEGYQDSYLRLEQKMGAIKNTRFFDQIENEVHRKCSLTGERDALFIGAATDRVPAYTQSNSVKLTPDPLISQGEGLSAISFVKRFWRKEGFSSTADIALLNWMKVAEEIASEEVSAFKKMAGSNTDGQLFFEENLSSIYVQKQGLYFEEADLKKMRELLKSIDKAVKKEKKVKKTPYYAILSFDGDQMGSWLEGKKLAKGQDLQKFHQNLAQVLQEFAHVSQTFVDNGKGQTIYAGGDDFMAYLSLDQLFYTLKHLRETFHEKVDQNPLVSSYKAELEDITFSAGLAVAHYKTPLREAIRTAKEMEKMAKRNGRNALAIKALKHAGESNSAFVQWGTSEQLTKNLLPLIELLNHLNKGSISRTFIQRLHAELLELYVDGETGSALQEIYRTETKRLVLRSINHKQIENPSQLTQAVLDILKSSKGDLSLFVSWLKIIDFLNSHTYATDN